MKSNTRYSVLFFGTPEFSCPTLKALIEHPDFEVKAVVTQPDKPAGRGHKLQASAIKKLALSHGLTLLQPKSLKRDTQSFCQQIQAIGAMDIGVVIAFGQILPKAVLDLPKSGCVNIHASLLPKWRGAAPIQRALENGDRETGVCLMQMDPGLDTGAVYTSAALKIEPRDTAGTLHDKLSQLGAALISAELPRICQGEITARAQDNSLATYADKISAEECEINWTEPASAIALKIRAFSPFPGAFSWLEGKRVKFFMAQAKQSVSKTQQPGRVALIDRDRLEIQCGRDVLCLEEAQIEGRKRLPISEFLRGLEITNESIFGTKRA